MQQGGTPVSVSGPQVLRRCKSGQDMIPPPPPPPYPSSSAFAVLFATQSRIFHDPIGRRDASGWPCQESCEQGWPCTSHGPSMRGSCDVAGQGEAGGGETQHINTSSPGLLTPHHHPHHPHHPQRNRTAQRKWKQRVLFYDYYSSGRESCQSSFLVQTYFQS